LWPLGGGANDPPGALNTPLISKYVVSAHSDYSGPRALFCYHQQKSALGPE